MPARVWIFILVLAGAALSLVAALVGGGAVLAIVAYVVTITGGIVGYRYMQTSDRRLDQIAAAQQQEEGERQNLANLQRQATFQRIPPAAGNGPEDS